MIRVFFVALLIIWPIYGLATGHWWDDKPKAQTQQGQYCSFNGALTYFAPGDNPPPGSTCSPAFGGTP